MANEFTDPIFRLYLAGSKVGYSNMNDCCRLDVSLQQLMWYQGIRSFPTGNDLSKTLAMLQGVKPVSTNRYWVAL